MRDENAKKYAPAHPGEVWFAGLEPGEIPKTYRAAGDWARVSPDGMSWERVELPGDVEADVCLGVAAIRGHLAPLVYVALCRLVNGGEVYPDDVRHGYGRYVRDFQTGHRLLMLCAEKKPGAFDLTIDAKQWRACVPDSFNEAHRDAHADADAWNRCHGVGVAVRYKSPDGDVVETHTTSRAYVAMLSAIVHIEGTSKTVNLARLEPVVGEGM